MGKARCIMYVCISKVQGGKEGGTERYICRLSFMPCMPSVFDKEIAKIKKF